MTGSEPDAVAAAEGDLASPPGRVFVSHSRADAEEARVVCEHLEAAGLPCWIAPRDVRAGASWSESIVEAIEESDALLLVYSEASNRSPQVQRELERAVAKHVPVVPLRLQDAPPSKSLEYFLGANHWLDAFERPLGASLDRLTRDLRSLRARSGGEPEPARRADRRPAAAADPSRGGSAIFAWDRLPLALRKVAKTVVFAAPIFFLARYLLEWSEASLWMPENLGLLPDAIGVGAGVTCFHLARLHASGRRREAAADDDPAEGERVEFEANRRGMLWWGATLALVALYLFLRAECVLPWNPSRETLWGMRETQAPFDAEADFRGVDLSRFQVFSLRPDSPAPSGHVLKPLFFPWTELGKEWLDAAREWPSYERRRHDIVVYVAEEIPTDYDNLIKGTERRSLVFTEYIFLLLHVGVLCGASVAYGYTFSFVEELVT